MSPGVFAGRDLEAGGTWLALHQSGRFAALTNIRSGRVIKAPRSRGELPLWPFAMGHLDLLARLAEERRKFAPFNLLWGDARGLYCYSSETGLSTLAPGMHALSNAGINTPWPKVERAKSMLADGTSSQAWQMLEDRTLAHDHELPQTGVSLEWERKLSSILITGEHYGTRCSTVLQWRGAEVAIEERTRDAEGRVTGAVAFSL
jgi:uncharacterized protein with NRDE domain